MTYLMDHMIWLMTWQQGSDSHGKTWIGGEFESGVVAMFRRWLFIKPRFIINWDPNSSRFSIKDIVCKGGTGREKKVREKEAGSGRKYFPNCYIFVLQKSYFITFFNDVLARSEQSLDFFKHKQRVSFMHSKYCEVKKRKAWKESLLNLLGKKTRTN